MSPEITDTFGGVSNSLSLTRPDTAIDTKTPNKSGLLTSTAIGPTVTDCHSQTLEVCDGDSSRVSAPSMDAQNWAPSELTLATPLAGTGAEGAADCESGAPVQPPVLATPCGAVVPASSPDQPPDSQAPGVRDTRFVVGNPIGVATRFKVGNRDSLKHGLYARGPREELRASPAYRERREALQADQGGAGTLSVVRTDAVDRYLELEALSRQMAEQLAIDGVFTERGKTRARFNAYLLVVDRWLRVAQLLGLERRQKPVANPLEVLARYTRPAADRHSAASAPASDAHASPDDVQASAENDAPCEALRGNQ